MRRHGVVKNNPKNLVNPQQDLDSAVALANNHHIFCKYGFLETMFLKKQNRQVFIVVYPNYALLMCGWAKCSNICIHPKICKQLYISITEALDIEAKKNWVKMQHVCMSMFFFCLSYHPIQPPLQLSQSQNRLIGKLDFDSNKPRHTPLQPCVNNNLSQTIKTR